MDRKRWRQANRELVAKAIRELTYEELLAPDRAGKRAREIELASGAVYTFEADPRPFPCPIVDPDSLRRDGEPVTDAARFLLDAQAELGLSDLAMGELLEEVQNTLFSETRRKARLAATSAAQLVGMPGHEQVTYFDGHPKLLADKGRVGWGRRALRRYAPESGNAVQLAYLAVDADRCRLETASGVAEADLAAASLGAADRSTLAERLAQRDLDPDRYRLFPVHPWQLQRYVRPQYAGAFAEDALVELGTAGDAYLPQLSIRTLANASRPEQADVKLALTILNTSCYRGIPGEHLGMGVELSTALGKLAASDPVLADREVRVLGQLGGLHVPHPHQGELAEGPYRFQEMLGAIWRESPRAGLATGEQAVPLAALMQTDADGRALVAEHVEASGMAPEAWLRELFDAVTVPLYHLMAKHGIGWVAHGQNVGLVLREHRPARAILKDVHGDLRLVDRDLPEIDQLPAEARATVERLRPEHLLQDLYTGHVVTTLRFVSPLVADQLGVPETRFYSLLGDTLAAYQDRHPELADRFAMFDVFADPIDKVLVNRARLRSGFGQDAERPEPTLGTPMANPIAGGGSG